MSSLAFAWRCLVRQPARAALGIAGVAAVGALLFDMLLLSQGLVISMRDLLVRVGFDVRVTATESIPLAAPRITDATATVADIAALPEVEAVAPLRFARAEVGVSDDPAPGLRLVGVTASARSAWTLIEGRDLHEVEKYEPSPILVNETVARALDVSPGSTMVIRPRCSRLLSALPPVEFVVAGVVDFPIDSQSQMVGAVLLPDFSRACGEELRDEVDLLLVASRRGEGSEATVSAIQRVRPNLNVFSNEQMIDQFQRVGFSYFRQISVVLATMTLFFAFLLVTALLTVSVNQRLAEIATLRALGFPRRRIAADLFWESSVLVASGGILALPIGAGVAAWLDAILRGMPDVPADLHFFVFQPSAVLLHFALLGVAGLLAALYPTQLAARLPIATTLRREVVS